MKNSDLLKFFALQRQIFGVCPNTNKLFRLSDCAIYLKKSPVGSRIIPHFFNKNCGKITDLIIGGLMARKEIKVEELVEVLYQWHH